MKITRIETHTVVVPIHEGTWHSAEYDNEGYNFGGQWIRLHWPEFPIVIMKLHTDSGLIGLGEFEKGVTDAEVRKAAEFFIGRDIWSFNLQDLPFETMWSQDLSVYAGYEMAMYDLVGKALDVPAYRLFGGKYRDQVPVSRCSGRMSPGAAAETARSCVEQGYSVLKMKATADDDVVDRLAAIQEAVGDQLKVVIDPNQRFYQPSMLFAIVDELRDRRVSNVLCFESPFDQSNLDWYVLARNKISLPLVLHVNGPKDIREAIKREACDWLNIGGPMSLVYKQAALAEAAGMPAWHGSGVGLGISEASYVHVSAACKAITLTSDICGESLRVDDLITEPLVIAEGHVAVPEGPGLGVTLDEDALQRYTISTATSGR